MARRHGRGRLATTRGGDPAWCARPRDNGPVTVAGPPAPLAEPVKTDQPVGDTDVDPDRPWVVIVWNDPINLMSYVTYVLQKLFGYPREVAEKLMLQVHYEGRAVVSTGTREKAELDVFRLHEHGLWATMQQD